MAARTIQNPILPGFNPDPSILRVGDDYYIATSTFEWAPGVQIHHSKDLVHWRLLTHALTEKSQLDMIGNPDSGGIWAPCLSWCDGVFYLVFTDVKALVGAYKDTPNYVVTASDIMGPWSAPVYLNSSGFDPSLFHDEDGKKWLINMVWDHRAGRNPFAGIVMQQYSATEKQLFGPIQSIFAGSALGLTEGPHLYKRAGYYYLITAEGGTGFEHAVTVARSRNLAGPYEVDPDNPMLTSRDKPGVLLQRAGHASLVHTQQGIPYLVHLCSRPVMPEVRSILGRETAIQQCEWTEEGWLRLAEGGNTPYVVVPAPDLPPCPWPEAPVREDFEGGALSLHYSTLRDYRDAAWFDLTARQGYLRLIGRESLVSLHQQSLVARRLHDFNVKFETALEFEPHTFQQMAGLVCYYNTLNHYYLRVSHDAMLGKCLGIVAVSNGKQTEPIVDISIEGWKVVHLRVEYATRTLQFAYSAEGVVWQNIGPLLDATILSDEQATQFVDGVFTSWGFTGAFVGIAAQDLTGQRRHADFRYVEYQSLGI